MSHHHSTIKNQQSKILTSLIVCLLSFILAACSSPSSPAAQIYPTLINVIRFTPTPEVAPLPTTNAPLPIITPQSGGVGIGLTPSPTPSPSPAPPPSVQVDPANRQSISGAFMRMLQNHDITFMRDLLEQSDRFFRTNNPVEGGQDYEIATFLADLQSRLANSPNLVCLGFVDHPDSFTIWTRGWEPPWEMTEFCYAECSPIIPALQSADAGMVFFKELDGNYHLSHMQIGAYDPNYWYLGENDPLLPCDPGLLNNLPPEPTEVYSCPGNLPPRLTVGETAYVSTNPPLANRVRQGPGKSYTVLGKIEPGNGMRVLQGPACADGMTWWEVEAFDTGLRGWTAEGDSKEYWLIPCAPGQVCGY